MLELSEPDRRFRGDQPPVAFQQIVARHTTGLPPVLVPGRIHRRCSLAFGCEARAKLDQPDSLACWVNAAVRREAALTEERREPPCLTTKPTSATLTIQRTSKITPTTSCSFLFVVEETIGL